MHPSLQLVDHRPWPLPDGPWIMEQIWNNLLFAHWPVPHQVLRPLVPPMLTLDQFEGRCWVAVAPFHMTGVHGRYVPPVPGLSHLPELNVRTYVTFGGKPGVFFFSLDAGSRIAVWTARASYHLPYFFSRMNVAEDNGWVDYECVRNASAKFTARYRPIGPVQLRKPGRVEHWLTERYCLYTVVRDRVYLAEIHHQQWPLQDAEAAISENTIAGAAEIALPQVPPLLHFAKKLQVLIWPLRKA